MKKLRDSEQNNWYLELRSITAVKTFYYNNWNVSLFVEGIANPIFLRCKTEDEMKQLIAEIEAAKAAIIPPN